MQELVEAEAKRERKRAALSAEVESLRVTAEEEFTRRCDLEQALRKAASLFKRELFEKGEEVAALQVQHALSHLLSTYPLREAKGPPLIASKACASCGLREGAWRGLPSHAT
jgi:hypothetical protein